MKIGHAEMTVADYCVGMEARGIRSNREYQRSDKVWPAAARSYLIETILLDMPIPKLSLHQVTDVRSKKAYKEIVDGQQRSSAILDFYQDKLRLSRTLDLEEAAGKKLSQLPDELRQQFLEYLISYDLFTGAKKDEVRQVFRRMNSYTVPLNAEEHRHAVYQGEFKWFLERLARDYDEALRDIGLFTEKQLVRMADSKLLTEVCHAFLYGISTTSRSKLDRLYKDKDPAFPEREHLDELMRGALDDLLEWRDIHGTSLMKHYHVYALLLAAAHTRSPVKALSADFSVPDGAARVSPEEIAGNLTQLAYATEVEDDAEFAEFVRASAKGTNVEKERKTRFRWFCRSLTQHSLP